MRRVREAVQAGNRPGVGADLEARRGVGYQGAGPDPVARFRDELTAAGGMPHIAADFEAATAKVMELVQARSVRNVLLARGDVLDRLPLSERLGAAGMIVTRVDSLVAADAREPFFMADVGISGVDYLVAETGSVIVLSRSSDPRSVSLLPPVHIAVAQRSQIVPDLFDLFDRLTPTAASPADIPACISVITGPSKTGDIELRLVTGVHGPGEIHVVLIDQ